MKHRVARGEGYYDVAMVTTGVVENAPLIAAANDAVVTDDIIAGSEVEVPDTLPTNVRVRDFYRAYPHPATNAEQWPDGMVLPIGGIGRMVIEITFVIG